MSRAKGTVYLIHFDRPFGHARHYVGWTTDYDRRIKQQRDINLDNLDRSSHDRGAVLMAYVNSAGIAWQVVRTWENVTRAVEATIKRNRTTSYCPICKSAVRARQRAAYHRRRNPVPTYAELPPPEMPDWLDISEGVLGGFSP